MGVMSAVPSFPVPPVYFAVLAVRSVVTRDVEPYAVVAGSPARKIGERT